MVDTSPVLGGLEKGRNMVWRERSVMDLREEFVRLALSDGANRRELCRRFGISAQTGYKWLRRYAAQSFEFGSNSTDWASLYPCSWSCFLNCPSFMSILFSDSSPESYSFPLRFGMRTFLTGSSCRNC